MLPDHCTDWRSSRWEKKNLFFLGIQIFFFSSPSQKPEDTLKLALTLNSGRQPTLQVEDLIFTQRKTQECTGSL